MTQKVVLILDLDGETSSPLLEFLEKSGYVLHNLSRKAEGINSRDNKIQVKDIEIDLEEHRVKKAGQLIDLTYIQFKLLYLLASRRPDVCTRQEILDNVWGRKVPGTKRTIDVHIRRLREKLGEYKYSSKYIETVHGTGYRFL